MDQFEFGPNGSDKSIFTKIWLKSMTKLRSSRVAEIGRYIRSCYWSGVLSLMAWFTTVKSIWKIIRMRLSAKCSNSFIQINWSRVSYLIIVGQVLSLTINSVIGVQTKNRKRFGFRISAYSLRLKKLRQLAEKLKLEDLVSAIFNTNDYIEYIESLKVS